MKVEGVLNEITGNSLKARSNGKSSIGLLLFCLINQNTDGSMENRCQMTNMSIEIPEGEEKINMCKAIEDMIKERACIEREEGKFEILIGLVKDDILSIHDAAKRMNMTEEEFRSKM